MEKSGEEKEKMEELFTNELVFAIVAIARRLIENDKEITNEGQLNNEIK